MSVTNKKWNGLKMEISDVHNKKYIHFNFLKYALAAVTIKNTLFDVIYFYYWCEIGRFKLLVLQCSTISVVDLNWMIHNSYCITKLLWKIQFQLSICMASQVWFLYFSLVYSELSKVNFNFIFFSEISLVKNIY
jgi:hypothetical protein